MSERLPTALQQFKGRAERLRLTEAETAALIERSRSGDIAARNRIVEGHLLLLIKPALWFLGRGFTLEELVSFGVEGLIRSAEKWEPSRGKFSTLATTSIRRAISNMLNSKNVRAFLETDAITAVVGREDRRGNVGLDSLPGPATPRPTDWHTILHRGLRRLAVRERSLISIRFGIGQNEGGSTLEQTARLLNISKQRVVQLQARALTKLQRYAPQLEDQIA